MKTLFAVLAACAMAVGAGGPESEDELRSRASMAALLGDAGETPDNAEVSAIRLDPMRSKAVRTWREGAVEVWTKALRDGSTAVGIFNLGAFPVRLSVGWRDIGVRAPGSIHDLWRNTRPRPLPFGYPVVLPPKGVTLLRIR